MGWGGVGVGFGWGCGRRVRGWGMVIFKPVPYAMQLHRRRKYIYGKETRLRRKGNVLFNDALNTWATLSE